MEKDPDDWTDWVFGGINKNNWCLGGVHKHYWVLGG